MDYESIRRLLDPPNTHLRLLLHCRAIPNQHLIRAFQLKTSTFTSPCPKIHTHFRRNIQTRLKALDSLPKWYTLREVVNDSIDFYLPLNAPPRNYAAHIQAVVFMTVLAAFFDFSGPFPDASDVLFVTQNINALWVASKRNTFLPVTLAKINGHLHGWIPRNAEDPFDENPLELIIPAYETLWRLIAYSFHYVEKSPELRFPLAEFYEKPTVERFLTRENDGTVVSVSDIIQEALRLHPPTKRLKRLNVNPSFCWVRSLLGAAGFSLATGSSAVAADIETIQRLPAMWGPLPNEYDPKRHKHLSLMQEASMMPFGCGPLKCMAYSVAPRLAGIVLAVMSRRQDTKLVRGEINGDRQGWKGWEISRRV
ncbi:cytochrome P450 [Hysterangium stoloniferum]|nr:cytochrome P450 [Hysterangium stoloniferum]